MGLLFMLKKISARTIVLVLLFQGSFNSILQGASIKREDAYIEGYAQAVMEMHYSPTPYALSVKNNTVYLTPYLPKQGPSSATREKFMKALKEIRGVNHVVFLPVHSMLRADASQPISGAEKPEISLESVAIVPASSKPNVTVDPLGTNKFTDGFMISPSIFKPLLADPRWPRFSLAYHNLFTSPLATHVFSPNFGATLPFYRHTLNNDIQIEIGVQAALFAVMDIGRSPSALINADYVGGAFAALTNGSWAHMIRVFHLSSHLGDEFMLTPEGKKTKRVNLSYETLSYLISHEQPNGVRLYGGGGYKVHAEPTDIKRAHAQCGLEYRHKHAYWHDQLRPVGGIDLTFPEQAAWRPNTSMKVGVQLENEHFNRHVTQLMLEFYQGRSMHGQFYSQPLRYLGVGLHVFL